MTRLADPPADRAVAAIVGPWSDDAGAMGPGLARLNQATRLMAGWATNASLSAWVPDAGTDPVVGSALQAYVEEARQLPAWARPEDIARAETLFMEYGPLSCTLLFCASLPQCYVVPQLADVLHVAGQLEAHTEYRIRQTAAMIFPVMLAGGLTDPQGCGVAQVLKVRLIHATIRHLILHGTPENARGRIPAAAPPAAAGMHAALAAAGWDVDRLGLPCNQFELAYTLLTFGYVFLQGMRTLRIPLAPEDERAYLHTWNVVGHVLGIRQELMAHTMDEAAALFRQMQAWAQRAPAQPDVRPALGAALMSAMAQSIRVPVLRKLPVPMTRWLVGAATASSIGIDQRIGLLAWLAFHAGMTAVRVVDGVVRLVLPQFSLTRMITRVLGYHLLTRFLLDQTRPLTLPDTLLQPMRETVAGWHHDHRAPAWVNALEDRLTAPGEWRTPP